MQTSEGNWMSVCLEKFGLAFHSFVLRPLYTGHGVGEGGALLPSFESEAGIISPPPTFWTHL